MSLHSRSMRLLAASTAIAFSTGCASSTVIRSDPSGASIYIDGARMGKTPYYYTDTKTVSSSTRIKLKKRGYEEFEALITRNERFQLDACVGGVFFLVPFLWVMGYNPERTFEMTPLQGAPAQEPVPQESMPQQPVPQQQQPLPPPPPPPPPNL